MNNRIKHQQIYRNNKSLDEKNDDIIRFGKYILKKYDYNPHSLVPESLIIENVNKAIEIGIDDILKAEEIPYDDQLNFKQVKPFNKEYFSLDYKSNNFGINNIENDDYIFVKLMEFLPKKWYNKEILLEKQRKGMEIKIKGILSERNPDYLLLIRNTSDKHREHIPKYSLINAYLLPVEPLRLHVINYLNIIMESNDEEPLELNKNIIDSILSIYQSWQFYRKEKRNYNFELFKARDSGRSDLIMKIGKDQLPKHIKFDLNGLISEYKS